tara:strand:+ start:388 stop:711 length:324 start_codon:yes stop_codon:yes gene_type:complete
MNFIKLYKAADANEAYFIKGLLEKYSIHANLIGEGLSIAIGELPLEVKQVDIFVPKNRFDRAKQIINNYEKGLKQQSNEKWKCINCKKINPESFEICWNCSREKNND